MITEFLVEREALKFVTLSLECLSTGYFVKIGKRIEKGKTVYWVMVPIEEEVSKEPQDGDR